MNSIPYGRQHITDEDIQSVVDVLKSDYLTQGPRISEFETAFANYVGAKYAVAVSNGTAALHLCAVSLGLKEGDKVITSPITFAASANCVRYCGAEVIFADINPDTYLIDIDATRSLLEADIAREIKGIIPVDFAGHTVNMEAWRKLADEFGCWIIEDACHAPGGFFNNHKNEKVLVGSGKYADLAIFSFHPVKHIAAGEGGMVTTNDQELYQALSELRTHGITKDSDRYKNSPELASGGIENDTYPAWYMEMQSLGFNYRLTDFQAALGTSQLKRADEGIHRRRELATQYQTYFQDKPYVLGQSGTVEGHAYHLYVIEVEDRMGLYTFLREHKIFAQIHYIPVHLMPYYSQFGWKKGDFPHAELYYSRCISLPMFPTLSDEEQGFVLKTISDYYNE